MPTYTNTDTSSRVWLSLVDPSTGRTLELAPGASVELESSIQDPYLAVVRKPKAPSEKE